MGHEGEGELGQQMSACLSLLPSQTRGAIPSLSSTDNSNSLGQTEGRGGSVWTERAKAHILLEPQDVTLGTESLCCCGSEAASFPKFMHCRPGRQCSVQS